MYSLEEAAAELQFEEEAGLRGPQVVHRLSVSALTPAQRLPSVHSAQEEEKAEQDLEGRNKSRASKRRFPRMPRVGEPVENARLVSRHRSARGSAEALLAAVRNDVDAAVDRAQHIPVHEDLGRLAVSKEVSQAMAIVRSRRAVEQRVQNNIASIQQALAFRKAALETMNENYSKVEVRRVDPIYAKESRTIVHHKGVAPP